MTPFIKPAVQLELFQETYSNQYVGLLGFLCFQWLQEFPKTTYS